MEFLHDYYNFDDFWNPENVTEQEENRIKEVLGFIPENIKSILDVGCGNGIFCNKVITEFSEIERVVGLDRNYEAIKYVKTERCIGDITKLPFPDKEFDLVVSLEVLEHLSYKAFEIAKREISRVSNKYILITVPNNEKLSRNRAKCPICNTSFNRALHMRSFTRKNLENMFDGCNFVPKIIETIGLSKNYIGIKYLYNIINIIRGIDVNMLNAMCPVCGYTKRNRGEKSFQLKDGSVKGFLHRTWPSFKRYLWLLALYEFSDI